MGKLEIKSFSLGSFLTNSYLVICKETRNCILIDAPQGLREIKNFIKKNRYKLLYVILTHGHIDHIKGLEEIDAPFYIHREDEPFLKNPSLNLSSFFSSPVIIERLPQLVEDNDTLSLDSHTFRVLHTPGHTPGSISIKLDEYLFSGDTLFLDSVGRTDIPQACWDVLLTSVREKIIVLHKDTVVLPGHGPSTTLRREIKHNPFLKECKPF
jgi:glyoxylase-like metal-dependent hydrolase (beta-lactamase superfamily II)